MIIRGKPEIKSPSLFASVKGVDIRGKPVLYFPYSPDLESSGFVQSGSVREVSINRTNNRHHFKAQIFTAPSRTYSNRLDYVVQPESLDARDIKFPQIIRLSIF